MSVDTRLRQARPEDDAPWETGLDLVHARVVRGARHRRIRHVASAAGAVAVLALGGLVAARTSTGDSPSPAPFAPTSTPSPTAPSARVSSPLDGEWRTRRLDRQDVVTALEGAGVRAAVAQDFVTDLPEGHFRYRLMISRGLLYARVDHQPLLFQQYVKVSGSSVTMTPLSADYGHWTYGWQRDGDQLTFVLRSTTVPDYDGFPARVHGLAAFCVARFTRTG